MTKPGLLGMDFFVSDISGLFVAYVIAVFYAHHSPKYNLQNVFSVKMICGVGLLIFDYFTGKAMERNKQILHWSWYRS